MYGLNVWEKTMMMWLMIDEEINVCVHRARDAWQPTTFSARVDLST
jgi:hypothetical protein